MSKFLEKLYGLLQHFILNHIYTVCNLFFLRKTENISRLEIELLLKEHFSSTVKQDEYQIINVRRKFILEDAPSNLGGKALKWER